MMTDTKLLIEHILDTAMRLADQRSWEAVRLHDIAAELAVPLGDIRGCCFEKDDLIDVWFDRADAAMLAVVAETGFQQGSRIDRMERAMMGWFRALGHNQRVTRQMMLRKMELGHVHAQILGLVRVNRTVQWMREAAGFRSTYLRRALSESALTSLYLATFCYWLMDDSVGFQQTQRFLRLKLSVYDMVAQITCWPFAHKQKTE